MTPPKSPIVGIFKLKFYVIHRQKANKYFGS